MIILDTNVLSEPMRANGNAAVAAWLDAQIIETLYLTTVSLAEVLLGIELMPLGTRRSKLEARIGAVINAFGDARMLAFDAKAARCFAVLVARARAAGHTLGVADGQIAAIAASRGFSVATRDTSPFLAAGIPVIDPWDSPSR
ncbi:MAG: VapC toxin family PIN domain ribonuclease [Rhodospirillales bacterium 20-64-7]|nr:MAG: VapC toxin family PIN domain ribonuclease [Rhodospirillales bacterium 20-64-7]